MLVAKLLLIYVNIRIIQRNYSLVFNHNIFSVSRKLQIDQNLKQILFVNLLKLNSTEKISLNIWYFFSAEVNSCSFSSMIVFLCFSVLWCYFWSSQMQYCEKKYNLRFWIWILSNARPHQHNAGDLNVVKAPNTRWYLYLHPRKCIGWHFFFLSSTSLGIQLLFYCFANVLRKR